MAKNLKIGESVVMVNCRETTTYKDKVWITRSEPWDMCGCEVVLLEGKSGGFDTSCLKRVEADAECMNAITA